MSAISGLVHFDGSPVDRDAMARAVNLLAVYGSDRCRTVYAGNSAFAWNCFAVTPEDQLDSQPIVDDESGLTILFDGRVDNREEMAAKVGMTRMELAETSDSGLVLRLVKRHGRRAPDFLRGDFALTCWDSSKRELWLARDPAGLRPLFWFVGSGFAAFSSMPKGLFCFPGIPKRLNQQYLADYVLLLPADGDHSLFEGVHRVIPGTIVTIDAAGARATHYHHFRDVQDVRLSSDDEYVEAFQELLDNAVRRRLRSATPITSYLSSGFDSSVISACAARLLETSERRLSCYTAVPAEGFELTTEGPFHVDEGPGARAVAAMYPNIDHRLIRTGHLSPLRDLDEMVDLLDRPPLNLCNTVWVNEIQRQAAAQGSRVLLSGALGNATISYDGVPHLAAMAKSFQWLSLARIIRPYLGKDPLRILRWFAMHTLGPLLPRWLWVFLETRAGRGFQSNPSAYTALNVSHGSKRRLYKRARELDFDLSYRPSSDGRAKRVELLTRVDIGEYYMLANARGIEQRAPALDRDLAEFCLGIPEAQYVGNRHFRWILIRAMRERLPRQVLYPKSAGLQAADWYVGASEDLIGLRSKLEEFSENQDVANLLDVGDMKALVGSWPEGGWGSSAVDQAYRFKLLRGLTVGAFVAYHERGNR